MAEQYLKPDPTANNKILDLQERTILVSPRKGSKVVGNALFSGTVKGASGNVYVYKGRRQFAFPGEGAVLNLNNANDRQTYDILTSKTLKHWFNPAAKLIYRFDVIDLKKDADEYLELDELKTDYKSQVLKLNPVELATVGFMLNLGKDPGMIKSGLYRKIDNDPKERAKIGRFLKNADRLSLLYIYHALQNGDEANSEGLYKNKKELFFWKGNLIGHGIDSVVAHLKKDEDESNALYAILKEDYENAVREAK